MRKRKYCIIKNSASAPASRIEALRQYQAMSSAECLAALERSLADKSPCYKFMDAGRLMPKTHNMVSTTHIKSVSGKIDLRTIAESIPNSSYDRKKFAAITIRIDNPKTTALLFSSGKLVITGAVSKQMAICAIRSVMYMLSGVFACDHLYYENHTIQNMVCNVRLPNLKSINVKQIHVDHSALSTYQPSIFPGLIFRPENSPIVLLIFKSSRIVVTGARTYTDIIDGFTSVLPLLRRYFVEHAAGSSAAPEPPAAAAAGLGPGAARQ